MNNRSSTGAAGSGVAAAVLAVAWMFISSVALAQQDSPGCDRACLRQALDTYMAAIFKHDPSAARLSSDHYSTLNTAAVRNGEGFWKDVTGYGELQRRYFDPVNGTVAYLGLLEQGGKPVVSSVRLSVQGGKVSEAEWMMQPGADPQRMLKYPPPEGAIPAVERSSRFYMISMANDYFQAGPGHDAAWIPTDLRCKDKDPNPITANPRHGDVCHDNFQNYSHMTKDVALRRFPLVDEEAGVIFGAGVVVRYVTEPRTDDTVNEYFHIRNGTFVYIWTVSYQPPKGSPVTTGWEDHQGDIMR
jgi:hypothetical protein